MGTLKSDRRNLHEEFYSYLLKKQKTPHLNSPFKKNASAQWGSPPPSSALHVCLHFLLLFPVSQWKTPRVRPEGVSFGSKLNRTRLEKKSTLAGVQQVRCVYDNGRVSLVLLIAGGGFIGTGKRMRRRGDMKCVCCQGRFCELASFGPLSLSLPQKSPGAKQQLKAHYQCVDRCQPVTLCSVRESLTS